MFGEVRSTVLLFAIDAYGFLQESTGKKWSRNPVTFFACEAKARKISLGKCGVSRDAETMRAFRNAAVLASLCAGILALSGGGGGNGAPREKAPEPPPKVAPAKSSEEMLAKPAEASQTQQVRMKLFRVDRAARTVELVA
jgi:hypothetical protein